MATFTININEDINNNTLQISGTPELIGIDNDGDSSPVVGFDINNSVSTNILTVTFELLTLVPFDLLPIGNYINLTFTHPDTFNPNPTPLKSFLNAKNQVKQFVFSVPPKTTGAVADFRASITFGAAVGIEDGTFDNLISTSATVRCTLMNSSIDSIPSTNSIDLSITIP